MSDAPTPAATTDPATPPITDPTAPTDPADPNPVDNGDPAPTETVEFWKQKSRENEKRAKANADAARRLTEIEEASKSDAQRAADRLAKAEKDASDARAEAARLRIATKYGMSEEDADDLLVGDDAERLERVAKRWQERTKPGTPRPDPSQGGREGAPAGADMNQLLRGARRA